MKKLNSKVTAIALLSVLFFSFSRATFANDKAIEYTVIEQAQESIPNARVRVRVLNLLGITISPCGLSIFFGGEVHVKQPDSSEMTIVSYSCADDLSEPVFIQPGTEITEIISINGTPFSNEDTVIITADDIKNDMIIIEVSVVIDFSLPFNETIEY